MPDQSATRYIFLARRRASAQTRLVFIFVVCCALLAGGCGALPGIKREVTVPSLIAPTGTADTSRLLAEVNRFAEVRSIRGKIDVQFLDTSFAKCGVAEKYSTADGDIIVQRPGQVYVAIKVPVFGTKVAEMTSDGERFRVAVLQGEERFRRFVRGTNSAVYPRLQMEAAAADEDCGGDDRKRQRNQQRTVSALSGLRPQHFTDALLVRPAAVEGANLIYARSEFFQEEPDDRPRAKRNSRVVRAYYLLDELAPQSQGEARLLRRFWFDRSEDIRLARLQTFDDAGEIVTDVVYKNPQRFGEPQPVTLPARLELTRPQERYSIRITYQAPETVVVNRPYEAEAFVLQNQWQLPELDLDKE